MTANATELSDQELVHGVLQAERELIDGRFRHSLTQLENTASLGVIRKRIARYKTELRAREMARSLSKDSLMQQFRGSFAPHAGGSAVSSKGGFLSGVVDKLGGNE